LSDDTIKNIIIAIIAVFPTTLSSIAALITAMKTKKSVGDLHLLVNGRLTELLELTARSARAEGVLDEKKVNLEGRIIRKLEETQQAQKAETETNKTKK
jgi:hypothetical protein